MITEYTQPRQPNATPSRDLHADNTYQDALLLARDYSSDALLAMVDAWTTTLSDLSPDPGFPGEVGLHLMSERRRAVGDELLRRERVSRIATGVASPADIRYQAYRDLANLIRERVELVEVFHLAGYQLNYAGRNSRRGCDEYAGPCILCGGEDRLRVWAGSNGRVWCRQCGWTGDVVSVTMSLMPGCSEFRDAIRLLSVLVGESVPA